jgi:hypothetical protein
MLEFYRAGAGGKEGGCGYGNLLICHSIVKGCTVSMFLEFDTPRILVILFMTHEKKIFFTSTKMFTAFDDAYR